MMLLTEIKIVHIGNFSIRNDGSIYSLKNYAQFFNQMSDLSEKVSVFGSTLTKGDTGFKFLNEVRLSPKIFLTLSRGNTPHTSIPLFILNNLLILRKLAFYCWRRVHYFIFLPSPMGVLSLLYIVAYRRKKSLGIYIGGHYQAEQKFEKRKGFIKKILKRSIALIMENLVEYAIMKSDYTITSSYKYYYKYKGGGKIFLTPPLLNVKVTDLSVIKKSISGSNVKQDDFITFCGELRHAKGVIDLVNAYIILVNENPQIPLKLKIIGSGQALDELRVLVRDNRITNKVVFSGQIVDKNELKEQLRNSFVCIIPSYSEGFPRVAYECFTIGVPTILTPVGGIPYLVKDRVHCLFVKPGDISGINEKIKLLLIDNSLRNKIAENALNLMRDEIFTRIRKEGSLAKMVLRKINK